MIFQGTRVSYGNLTPFIPLSTLGEGEEILERGLRLLSFFHSPFPCQGKGVRGIGYKIIREAFYSLYIM